MLTMYNTIIHSDLINGINSLRLLSKKKKNNLYKFAFRICHYMTQCLMVSYILIG